MGAVGTLAAEPLNLGFDVNIGGCAAGGLASYTIPNEDASYSFGSDGRIPFPLINQYAEKESNYHITDAITKAAKSEIDRAVEDETPFYMYMSHYAVHSPYQEDSRFIDRYGSGNSTTRNYGTLITGMDRSLGELMDYLEEKKIADKTIIIFMADNGGHHWNKNTPLKGSKGSLWEGGIHEPMMVYWPGVTDAYAGQTNDSPVIIEDFFPTILEMANIKESSYASRLKQVVDGQSFVAALRGNKLINTERQLIFHYPNRWGEATTLDGNAIGEPSSAIIEGGWKYIYFYNDNSEFLYNLNNDETEQINLAASESVKKEEMAKKLSDYLKSVDATMVYNKSTQLAVYPDQSTKDMSAVYSPDADGVLYLDFGNQKNTVETIPAVGLGSDTVFLSGTDSRKIRFDDSAEGSLDVSFSGIIKPNGDKGCFASVDEANAFGTLISGFAKEADLTTKYQAVWGDAVTLESEAPRITVTFRGMPADGSYELKLLSVRNNNWYGSAGSTKITNAVYDITSGTVSGTPVAVGIKKTSQEDVSSKAILSDTDKFTINQDGTDTEVWGFCLTWNVTPVNGTVVLDISGVCAVTALRIEKR
ncbi:MAG: sulfatase-like hydrolase/transferase [Spirochaetia bacterium]|nr:sulfatase-like hydrolase/transferase [Spirochaetia bacterium]